MRIQLPAFENVDQLEQFTKMTAERAVLLTKTRDLFDTKWEEICKLLLDIEKGLIEKNLVTTDPYASFSIRGQVLGVRQARELKIAVETQLRETLAVIEQLRKQTEEE